MTMQETLATQLATSQKYFQGTVSIFDEDDSVFAPTSGMFTAAAQVAHAADTVDWFVKGAFGEGWDLDFAAIEARIRKATSLADAKAWLDRAFAAAIEAVRGATDEELLGPIPDERMFKGQPRAAIVNGIVDHTAHHRGSLAVYARVIGKTPKMPYA